MGSMGENIIQRLVNKPKDCGNNMKNELGEDEIVILEKFLLSQGSEEGGVWWKTEKDQETDSKECSGVE